MASWFQFTWNQSIDIPEQFSPVIIHFWMVFSIINHPFTATPIDGSHHIPVVPARGGAEVALDFTIRPFSSIELACAVRPPGVVVQACVRACCCVAVQEHGLCAITLQCNATRTFLHTSHCTFHSPHFTLHTSYSTLHLISSRIIWLLLTSCHLISALLISSHPTCHLSKFFSTVFISSEHWKKVHLNSSHLFCTPERSYR